ncbi:MAG: integrin alpha, partial [Ferruginibacter sp.]
MYKIFALALAASVLPVSNRYYAAWFITDNTVQRPANIFPYKNTIATNPFEPEKKPTETWSQNWMASAQENIRKSEYNFKWEEKLKAYCTPNRKNNLRFFYTGNGFSVEPRTTKIPIGEIDPKARPDEIKYKTIANWKIKFNLDKKQLHHGKWQIVNNTAEYITDNITVQYINNDEGMRQNFIVHKPLTASNELKINFNIKTKLKTKLNSNRLQFFYKKTNVLNYKDLKVWDANNKSLSASFHKKRNGLFYIQVDSKDAVYPITIDPLSAIPDSSPDDADQANAWFGQAVASAGDVNGDGYSDVIIGAWGFNDGGNPDEGRAFVYHGSAAGLSAVPNSIRDDANQIGANFGISVSSAGDINNDGYSDVIVGAYSCTDGGNVNEGLAFVYHGSAAGISATPNSIPDDANQANANFGASVSTAGDVNGDGYSDVIIGAPFYNDSFVDEGVAFLYYGSAGGLAAAPVSTPDDANQTDVRFGWSVAAAGDVNGDGFSDIIIGAWMYNDGAIIHEGLAFIYHGSAAGLSATPNSTPDDADQLGAHFGYSVACAGDVNGDGYSDVIIGAFQYDDGFADEGKVFVYHGSASGVSAAPNNTPDDANQAAAYFGYSVAAAGDVNGDGYSDVIIGAYGFNDGANTDEGQAFVYFGSATGLPAIPDYTADDADQANAFFGAAVASAGDVNGDGYSDVIIGAPFYNDGFSDEGKAFVYHGSAAGLAATPNSTPDDADQIFAHFGISIASAGDVNGDGYSDIIIGAWSFDDGFVDEGKAFVYHGSATGLSATPNSTPDDADQASVRFGISVAGAGDVNGDGYGDVIIGAYQFDDGFVDEGKAFVYHGSATGLSTSPNSTPDDADQLDARFGVSVAGAGDVNGDGYSDVIIGCYRYNDSFTDEGVAFVYHGSATGLSASPNSTPDDANQAFAQFGYSVAGAGDVNGDGYSDVIVGAFQFDNGQADEGAAFVYHGSATGIVNTFTAMVESNQATAYFGCSVASAGDVNGDGYSDVIIGAYWYDDVFNFDEGRAFVYHGSATGISLAPNSIPDDADQNGAQFGISVAGAGDVNGDGYSDVIIGANLFNDGANTSEGRAFLYYGSAASLSASPNSTPDDADQANAWFGYSVASAGDVNGDGYS